MTALPRVLLASVFKPFTLPTRYTAPGNLIEHGLFHRSFTRRQGLFTILDQQYIYPLHLMAENLEAHTCVLEYPTEDEFAAELERGRYDVVGISCVAATLAKARRMCQIVRACSPGSQTVIGGGGAMAVGDGLMEPFSDHVCRADGVRFMQDLLGEVPRGPFRSPMMPVFHGANRLLGLPLHQQTYPVVAGLGCHRKCEFCSTSHQFDGQYLPLFETGEQLFGHMQRVERHERRHGRHHEHLSFLVYDENFLHHRELVDQFRRLNREQLLRGTQYLLFIFSDATILSEYSHEELLELGADTIWVGVESPTLANYDKVEGVDTRRLTHDLWSSGFKVIASMIAGLEDHTEALIREDMEYALSLSTIGVQYMPVNAIPGTTLFERLRSQGLLSDRDLSYFSMSHYNIRHPTLDEDTVLGLIEEYYEREHAENGPLVYRFLEGRWQGFLRHRHSKNPYVRARTRVYAADLLRGMPVMLLGERLCPTATTRARFTDLRRRVQGQFGRLGVLADMLTGQRRAGEALPYLLQSLPGLQSVFGRGLVANAVLRDPRTRGLLGLLQQGRGALNQVGRGRVPWEQPVTVRVEYPAGGELPFHNGSD